MSTRLAGLTPEAGRGVRDDEVELGSIVGVFGVRGEVRLHLHHRESELFDEPRSVILVDLAGARFRATLQARPGAGGRVLGRVQGWTTREQAEQVHGWKVVIAESDLPPPGEGEHYVRDLIGLPVVVDGVEVGRLLDVHETEGGDILEVDVQGESEFVPLHAEWVSAVEADRIVLTELPWGGEE